MKRDLIRFFGILITIIFFSLFVYPTPYYYSYYESSHFIVKINRFTGNAYILNPSLKEWTKIAK
jgi:hypothetical protein